ncbi:hypothetical protein PG996_014777 [Apiospora saccharicola]|uniref:Uncharacterized protein n=1 Tax=Apiospora saccharicola TaxID=335842 RepID=A0ABR1TLZ1_9PEZI
MKAPLASLLLLLHHTVLGRSSPATIITPRHAAASEETHISSATTSQCHGEDASPAATYGFLALVESWQHRRTSGYYVLADTCGDVITVYHDPSHVRLRDCYVTQCTEALRDDEAEAVRTGTVSSSTSTWCNESAIRPADSATSLYRKRLLPKHREYAGRADEW